MASSGELLAAFHEWGPGFNTTMALASLSTALYGFNISLAISCLRHIWTRKKTISSKSRLWGSCLYICVMTTFASQAIIQLHIYVVNNIKSSFLRILPPFTVLHDDTLLLLPEFSGVPMYALPPLIWGADGVLIWRCVVLYKHASRGQRVFLYVFLGFLALASVASGIYSYTSTAGVGREYFSCLLVLLLPITGATNGIIAILISARLIHAHRLLSKLQSQPGIDNTLNHRTWQSPYLTALAICVESSAIIVITAISCQIPQWGFSPILILPQICVSAPLLIIYRVAAGRRDDYISKLEETIVFRRGQHSQASAPNANHGD